MMKQDFTHTTRTKENLKNAFIELYSHKPLKSITVKDITDYAGCNRGTFYVYFKDIPALLDDIENGLTDYLIQNTNIAFQAVMGDHDFSALLPQLDYYKIHCKYFKALLGIYGNPAFIYKIKTAVKQNLAALYEIHPNSPAISEYVLEYMISAHFGVIHYWLERDMDLSSEVLIQIMSDVFLHGPYHSLSLNK